MLPDREKRESAILPQSLELAEHDGCTGMSLEITGASIHLPIAVVGSEDSPVVLFLFDPNKPEIASAGANALSQLIVEHGRESDLWFTPYSDKSVPMVREAHALANGQTNHEIQVLPRTKHPHILEIGDGGKTVEYHSITSPFQKMLGVTKEQLDLLDSSGDNAIVVDDIYSRGGTVGAARKIMGFSATAFVVAQELPAQNARLEGHTLTFTYPQVEENGVVAATRIPLITGVVAQKLANLVSWG